MFLKDLRDIYIIKLGWKTEFADGCEWVRSPDGCRLNLTLCEKISSWGKETVPLPEFNEWQSGLKELYQNLSA